MQDTENPYAAPQASSADVNAVGSGVKRKLFSPTQGAAGAFLFGPLTGLYIIQANFSAMNESTRRSQSIIYGIVATIAFALLTPFIPDKIPGVLFGLLYMAPTKAVMDKFQLSKPQIEQSEQFIFHSNWLVFGIGILAILVYLVFIIAVMFFYAAIGWIEPLM